EELEDDLDKVADRIAGYLGIPHVTLQHDPCQPVGIYPTMAQSGGWRPVFDDGDHLFWNQCREQAEKLL
ncbi:hypothetical protein LCGC14_1551010, partial [marine sediment metagenome]